MTVPRRSSHSRQTSSCGTPKRRRITKREPAGSLRSILDLAASKATGRTSSPVSAKYGCLCRRPSRRAVTAGAILRRGSACKRDAEISGVRIGESSSESPGSTGNRRDSARSGARRHPSVAPAQFSIQVVMMSPQAWSSASQQLWPSPTLLTSASSAGDRRSARTVRFVVRQVDVVVASETAGPDRPVSLWQLPQRSLMHSGCCPRHSA